LTTRNLVASLSILLVLVNVWSCTQESPIKAENVASEARKVLETPFHFLLRIPDYEPKRLVHDADMFSAWGELELERKGGTGPTRLAARERLLSAARNAGWRPTKDLADLESPDLERYGIGHTVEDLAISQTASLRGQKPPTRYSCRIWISDSGSLIVAAYRVDGE